MTKLSLFSNNQPLADRSKFLQTLISNLNGAGLWNLTYQNYDYLSCLQRRTADNVTGCQSTGAIHPWYSMALRNKLTKILWKHKTTWTQTQGQGMITLTWCVSSIEHESHVGTQPVGELLLSHDRLCTLSPHSQPLIMTHNTVLLTYKYVHNAMSWRDRLWKYRSCPCDTKNCRYIITDFKRLSSDRNDQLYSKPRNSHKMMAWISGPHAPCMSSFFTFDNSNVCIK